MQGSGSQTKNGFGGRRDQGEHGKEARTLLTEPRKKSLSTEWSPRVATKEGFVQPHVNSRVSLLEKVVSASMISPGGKDNNLSFTKGNIRVTGCGGRW